MTADVLKPGRTAFRLLALFLLFGTAACGGQSARDDAGARDTSVAQDEPMESLTLVDVAVADSTLSTLVAALEKTGLAQTLQGPGPFTVFAPTNAAFAALPAGTLDGLPPEALTNILAYHIAGGRMAAADLAGVATLLTTQGSDLAVTVGPDGTVKINEATVVVRDVEASNGVLHVIDAVLPPPSDDAL